MGDIGFFSDLELQNHKKSFQRHIQYSERIIFLQWDICYDSIRAIHLSRHRPYRNLYQ